MKAEIVQIIQYITIFNAEKYKIFGWRTDSVGFMAKCFELCNTTRVGFWTSSGGCFCFMFGPGTEFYNPEGSAPDKVIFEALVSIQQAYQLPAVVLYSFEAIEQYKS